MAFDIVIIANDTKQYESISVLIKGWQRWDRFQEFLSVEHNESRILHDVFNFELFADIIDFRNKLSKMLNMWFDSCLWNMCPYYFKLYLFCNEFSCLENFSYLFGRISDSYPIFRLHIVDNDKWIIWGANSKHHSIGFLLENV